MTFAEEAEEFMENSIKDLQPKDCSIQSTTCNNIQMPKGVFVNLGWICPKCGRALSPFIHECPHCKVKESVISNTTMICD